ncbi:MAG TPA: hypothetical protein PLS70_24605, partial [Acidobacteriota bacterium]|nr:hypothetical protein [Acidobacteriota bacterium]
MSSQIIFRYLSGVFFALTLCFASAVPAMALTMPPPAPTVSISPTSDTLPFKGTRQFTATVTGTPMTTVIWSVNDIPGGNSSVGTISTSGLYTAPAALPPANPVMVKAKSAADQTVSAVATVTVRYPTPVVQWFSPAKVPLGQSIFTLNGSQFYNGAVVMLDGTPLPTTYVSATQLKATSNVMQSSSGYITVANPGPAGATSTPRLIEFGQGITVTITPSTAMVAPAAQQQFTANVSGTTNTTVYWYVTGGSANGTITSSGLYKAPNSAPASPVTIRAVCAVNSERSATATVTVTNGAPQTISVSISPTSASVQINAQQQFTASVTGTANTAVTWQVNGVTGGNATTGTITDG